VGGRGVVKKRSQERGGQKPAGVNWGKGKPSSLAMGMLRGGRQKPEKKAEKKKKQTKKGSNRLLIVGKNTRIEKIRRSGQKKKKMRKELERRQQNGEGRRGKPDVGGRGGEGRHL